MGLTIFAEYSRYYPGSALNRLREQRGGRWGALIEWISRLPGSDPRVMALTRTLRQLVRAGDAPEAPFNDPFCAVCASGIVKNFPGSEDDLLSLYGRNLNAINQRLSTMRRREADTQQQSAIA